VAYSCLGHGIIAFDDNDYLETAEGYFFDTNFAQIKDEARTRVKHFGLYRCPAGDVEKMRRPFSREARALIKNRIKTLHGR
jgi:hypothetical protein